MKVSKKQKNTQRNKKVETTEFKNAEWKELNKQKQKTRKKEKINEAEKKRKKVRNKTKKER